MTRYLTRSVMFALVALAAACGGGGGGSKPPPPPTWTNLIAPTIADMSADVTVYTNWNSWANGDAVAPTRSIGADVWAGTMEVTDSDYGTAGTTHDGVDATDFGFYVQLVAGDGSAGNGSYHLQVGKTYQVKIKAASDTADQWAEIVVQDGGSPYAHHITFAFQPAVATTAAGMTEYTSPEFTVSADVPSAWFVVNLGGNSTSNATFWFDDAALNEK